MILMEFDKGQLEKLLRFRNGLIPVVVQDRNGVVLMLAYMNRKALAKSLSTGFMHYWSRSRRKLWKKGEVSGHTQKIIEVRVSCEGESLLFKVEQISGCCHKGYRTCFYRAMKGKGLKIVEKKLFEPKSIYGRPQKRPFNA